jgi:hypothetical protein
MDFTVERLLGSPWWSHLASRLQSVEYQIKR